MDPKFFFFFSHVLERAFWTARFWTTRFGSDARFGPPVLDSPSIGPIQPPQLGTVPQLLSSSWLLMAPRILTVAPSQHAHNTFTTNSQHPHNTLNTLLRSL